MHRYRQPIAVRCDDRLDGQMPAEFRWRGRRYLVREVLGQWVEALPWWSHRRGASRITVWRVEAVTRTGNSGVYDLCAVAEHDWRLLRVLD